MARNLMGCTTADVAVAASNGALQPGSGPWPVYTTGPYRDTSVAITDLTDMAGNPVSQVTFMADGVLRYFSPDGDTSSTHWLDVGQGLRIAVRPVSIVGPAGAVGPPGPTAGPASITTAMLQDASVTSAKLAAGVANGLDHRSGPGSPEGVRAAPVGSTWTQTDALALGGIVVWRKTSGTGTSGWTVETGDTGWLSAAGRVLNGWTVNGLHVRRIGAMVSWRWTSVVAGTANEFVSMPPGFRPGASGYDLPCGSGTGAARVVIARTTSLSMSTASTAQYTLVQYPTDDSAWLTVAP